jgi:hypothetical protein
VNVYNPASPTEIGSYETPGSVRGVAISAPYAYIAAKGLHVMNVSDPAHPNEVGSYNTPGAAGEGITLARPYAYIAGGFRGLDIVDVSNPAQPTGVGFYDTPGYANEVAVSGAYIYIADIDGGLIILRSLRDKATGSIPPSGGTLFYLRGYSVPFPRRCFHSDHHPCLPPSLDRSRYRPPGRHWPHI